MAPLHQKQLKTKPLILGAHERKVIEEAIAETCGIRKWSLLAFNLRTNHVHTVVSARPEPDATALSVRAEDPTLPRFGTDCWPRR